MKPTLLVPPSRHHEPRGFALVISLSLMVLLTVLAVGLLGLSTITLRSSSQGEAMAAARANARLGLMLAVGQLQKHAGPDQRVTARADILGENGANPRLTGVWRSWQIQPDAPPSPGDYEAAERHRKFLGWLASCADGRGSAELDFAEQAAAGEPATLWGKGSLGDSAPDRDVVKAEKVTLAGKDGGFAWAVMDEGVKARINTPFVETTGSKGMQTAQLGSGSRPDVAAIGSLDLLKRSYFAHGSQDFATIEKGISRLNFGLAAEQLAKGTEDPLKLLAHDVTTQSTGLFTDVAAGGLKEDFNLLTNGNTLPAGYSGKGVYASRFTGVTGPSDPRWESLHQLAKLYKDTTRLTSLAGVPLVKAQTPAGWKAATGSDPNSGTPGTAQRTPPPGLVLMPTVAKVQVVFSLLTRDIYNYPKVSDTTPKPAQSKAQEESAELHGPWGRNFAGSSYDYLLHLLYTPVVTLHNPYNVALEFSELKVVFGNVPFALQVFRNGQPQTREPAPLDTMFYSQSETGTLAKRFGMTLKTNGGTPTAPAVGSGTFRLLPGEVMLFSPYIDPNRTWKDEYANRTFSDWDTGSGAVRTLTINGLPGWRGDGIGFDLDWFCPSYKNLRITDQERDNNVSMGRGGCIGAKASDEFSVKFAPLSVDSLSKNKFTVEMFAKPVGSAAQVSTGVIEMDYESPTGLRDFLMGADGSLTYPKDGTVNTMAMHSHSLTKIKDINTVKPFAIISAQAKTSLGGQNPDGEDGKLATKPWCFAHAVAGTSFQKVRTDHPSNHSHEISLQRLENGTNNLLQFDPKTGRGNFITGLTGNTGLKFGVLYDLPLAPLQSLAQLNAANPGGSSGYLPRFAQPVGNSWAHPLVNPAQMITPQAGGNLLDHSFLLNLALYDRYYFSGLGDQTGAFGTAGRVTKTLAGEFTAGTPLADPRLAPHAPDGQPLEKLADEATATGAHAKIAAWQVIHGPFNINSTSVAAWKAMLGSIHDGNALVNLINKTNKNSTLTALTATDEAQHEARISRFRLPAGHSEKDGGDPAEAYWLGAREYTGGELQLLAEKIVEQVRERGPFLSLAEFVNRRLGADETARRGALQQAIDEAGLNEQLAVDAAAGYDIPAATVASYNYRNSAAGTGSSHQGAPGYLSQADLLTVLGNAATPRSDTFTIRACGEARDPSGKVTATAWCEAVVQRFPEYLDPADKADATPAALASTANRTFGRRFEMVSFRWLGRDEI